MQRHCGLDLNGWRDTACRNWTIAADGDERSKISYIKAGVFPSLVCVGDRETPHWVGGFQSALAPHGRGPGWGDIGCTERRVAIRDLLADSNADVDLLTTALSHLCDGASHAVLAIDDTPRSDETRQEKFLLAMHRAGLRQPLLVWRPVLAVLALNQTRELEEGDEIGVINHERDGFAIQTLHVRREATQTPSVFAPERSSSGQTVTCDAGYGGLEIAASKTIKSAMTDLPSCEIPRAVGRLALGLEASPEILRTEGGGWVPFVPPHTIELVSFSLSNEVLQRLSRCGMVLFESLTSGRLKESIVDVFKKGLEREIIVLPEFSVAEGALEAANRMARDEPIYFDFLPQISTIVTDRDTGLPKSYDLIDPADTVRAGRIYRSPKPAALALKPGTNRLSIYLKKKYAKWPRKALVDLGTKVSERAPLEVSIEQAPLAGSAKVALRSPVLSRQHTIDWSTAKVVKQDWQSLIEGLDVQAPTIPKKLVLPCAMDSWLDWNRREGLLSLLRKNDKSLTPDWEALATTLSRRPNGKFCISSEGRIPPEVPPEATQQLDRLTQRAVQEEVRRFDSKSSGDNARLRFLLWQFRRCPEIIVERLINCVVDRTSWREIFPYWQAWRMILLGLGRCCTEDSQSERNIISYLLSRPIDGWKWWGENACAAFILSMSDTAPKLLRPNDIENISQVVIRDFSRSRAGDFKTFFYAPFLMAGLLRWRILHRRALIEGQDDIADSFAKIIRKTLPAIEQQALSRPNLRKYEKVLKQILDELRGRGSNPELLIDIFGCDSEIEE